MEIAGKTLGIVGMGHIGQAVCRIARAFGMDVIFENRSPKPDLEGEGVRQVNLDELLASSDVVTLHVPATPETSGMMDAGAIAKMKDGAILLNTARGTLVDEQAVADALHAGKLGGFGADVVSVEPMKADNPLLSCKGENIVVTPHIAWATHEAANACWPPWPQRRGVRGGKAAERGGLAGDDCAVLSTLRSEVRRAHRPLHPPPNPPCAHLPRAGSLR